MDVVDHSPTPSVVRIADSSKGDVKKTKDIEKLYLKTNVFESVKDEFEAIAGIVTEAGNWEEV